MGPPGKRRGVRRGQTPNPSESTSLGSDGLDTNLEILVSQLLPRPVRPNEIPELRAVWWRQAGLGHRLPAERGVIVLEGGTK